MVCLYYTKISEARGSKYSGKDYDMFHKRNKGNKSELMSRCLCKNVMLIARACRFPEL